MNFESVTSRNVYLQKETETFEGVSEMENVLKNAEKIGGGYRNTYHSISLYDRKYVVTNTHL